MNAHLEFEKLSMDFWKFGSEGKKKRIAYLST